MVHMMVYCDQVINRAKIEAKHGEHGRPEYAIFTLPLLVLCAMYMPGFTGLGD